MWFVAACLGFIFELQADVFEQLGRRVLLKKILVFSVFVFMEELREMLKFPLVTHDCVCRVAVEVVTTMTSADVMWQDGTVETNIRSNELIPVHHLDNNEFCPGDFVVDKRGTECHSHALLGE